MKKINSKGFTLIELLAAITILSIMMLLAIPNVVGVVQRNKNKTYVEDAKKMITLAKYKIKKKPFSEGSECYKLEDLDESQEINDAPNGGTYEQESSWVKVIRDQESGEYQYRVQIVEKKNDKYTGLSRKKDDYGSDDGISEDDLYDDNSYDWAGSIDSPNQCY